MKKLLLILAIAFASCTAARHQRLYSGKYVITSCEKKGDNAIITLMGVKGKFVFPANDSLAVSKEITVISNY